MLVFPIQGKSILQPYRLDWVETSRERFSLAVSTIHFA
jgi:hypothetical protein